MKKDELETQRKKQIRSQDATRSMFCPACGEVLHIVDNDLLCPQCHSKEPVLDKSKDNSPVCPDCGQSLHRESGRCWVCANCGYSSCPIA